MAKGFILIICFCFVSVCNAVSTNSSSYGGRVTLVSELYTKELGVRELTGNNDGKRVQEYLKSTGLQGNYAWCGAFVNFVLKSANVTPRAKAPAQARSWFNSNVIETDRAAKADLFALYYAHLKRIGHVGFIDDVTDSSFITVEGNTNEAGSREGDGVYRKRRMKRSVYKVSRWIH
jgi:hypothetical protein